MKKLSLIILCLLLSCSVASKTDPGGLNVGFSPPQPESWILDNGLKVFFLRDEELPLLKGTLFLKGGSYWENSDQVGLTEALGAALRRGGAGPFSSEAFEEEIERLAVRISSTFAKEYGTIKFSCLSSDSEKVFSLLSDMIIRPHFEEEVLEIWKDEKLERIRQRLDDPSKIAMLTVRKLLFPKSPYGQVLVEEDLSKITRPILLEAHSEFIRPDQSVLSIAGKISREDAEELIKREFGVWDPRGRNLNLLPRVEDRSKSGIYFVEAPVKQAAVVIGQQGVRRLTEDHYSIAAFNQIFGMGGFSSRMISDVRVKKGLAYQAFGGVLPEKKHGRNLIFVQTKGNKVDQAVRASLRVLGDMQGGPVSDQELEDTKQALSNAFVFKFDSSLEVVERKALFQVLEYPEDYDELYLGKISGVTKEGIQKVALKHWNIQRFVIVVVGNENAYNSIVRLIGEPDSIVAGLEVKRISFGKISSW